MLIIVCRQAFIEGFYFSGLDNAKKYPLMTFVPSAIFSFVTA